MLIEFTHEAQGTLCVCPASLAFPSMTHFPTQPSTVASALRAKIVHLLIKELGYEPAAAKQLVVRHEGLMLKSLDRDQPLGPIAFAIHLAHQRESEPAA